MYANEHGEKDDFGFAWLPQLFVELDDGRVVLVLSKIPFNTATLKPDLDEAKKIIEAKLRDIGVL
ncbi:MAG: hypothetical protein QXU60_03340 [Sulfolobales archaeon]